MSRQNVFFDVKHVKKVEGGGLASLPTALPMARIGTVLPLGVEKIEIFIIYRK